MKKSLLFFTLIILTTSCHKKILNELKNVSKKTDSALNLLDENLKLIKLNSSYTEILNNNYVQCFVYTTGHKYANKNYEYAILRPLCNDDYLPIIIHPSPLHDTLLDEVVYVKINMINGILYSNEFKTTAPKKFLKNSIACNELKKVNHLNLHNYSQEDLFHRNGHIWSMNPLQKNISSVPKGYKRVCVTPYQKEPNKVTNCNYIIKSELYLELETLNRIQEFSSTPSLDTLNEKKPYYIGERKFYINGERKFIEIIDVSLHHVHDADNPTNIKQP